MASSTIKGVAFNSYLVNERGEVIPVKSFNFNRASESDSKKYDEIAFAKAKEALANK